MQIISSEAYNATMNSLVLPFLKQARQSGIFERVSGQPLYYEYYHAMAPKGTLVLVHGFTEGIAKFREMVYYFLRSGLDVWQLQQREHGKSYRSTSDPFLVYIEDYNDLVEDLHSFIVDVVKNDPDSAGLPLYLMGHSMGGGVSACLLSRYPDLAVKAVLTSPMLEMNSGNIPVWAAKIFAKTMILLGKGRNYMPGSTAYSPDDDFEHACATSPERYTWWLEQTRIHKEYQMSACAISTALQFLLLTQEAVSEAACRKIKTPVLLLQAGKDDLVGAQGQETFINRIGSLGTLKTFPEAKHEIYRSTDDVLQEYLDAILAFLL